ncbi:MAG: SDR family NAD(P)-dependent oxidoreductase [Cyclobacteriaceae bacterium]|nr:SDR family NAD(P)-dependent oxidoreductase [Cyclobacteriaceae bacterium]MCH8514716.1 SDR family NAD(P)-dependent oxidoreductase [Cyclobacteriaceae bacterium]
MRVFIITGSSKGIGKALAEQLLSAGNNHVVGISRTHSIDHENYQALSIDLSTEPHVWAANTEELFTQLSQREWDEAVLINNAGMLGTAAYVGELNPGEISRVLHLNVSAVIQLTHQFLKAFRGMSFSRQIINISSGAGKSPVDGWGLYCTSKAALDMFSEVVALEQRNRKESVKVFAVAPGVVDTEMQSEIRASDPKQFSKIDKFLNLKNENQLYSPDRSAKKIIELINRKNEFESVTQDVRKY